MQEKQNYKRAELFDKMREMPDDKIVPEIATHSGHITKVMITIARSIKGRTHLSRTATDSPYGIDENFIN